MELKYFFYVILALTLIYFRFGPGVRMLKKKSHHYMDPPAATEDPNWIPIEMEEYTTTVFLQINTIKDTVETLKQGIGEEFPKQEVSVIQIDDCFVISLANLSFMQYHELIFTLSMVNTGHIWGYSKHLRTASKDYVVMHDREAYQPHLFGAFRDDTNFGIFLMKSEVHPQGNMSKSVVSEVDFEDEILKLPIDEWEATANG